MSLVEAFCNGEYDPDASGSSWKITFKYISENFDQLEISREKVHTLWTVNGGHLRRKIQDDPLIAKVLTVTLPGYSGEGLILYRGECSFLYQKNLIGFCWTPEIEVARIFARGLNAIESGGVLLRAFAPSSAILAAPNKHSSEQMKEFEYTSNPYMLKDVELIDTYPKFHN